MEEKILLDKLVFRGIKPTAMRVLILQELLFSDEALSLTDLEARLDTVDRSTIFRTVTLFLSHHLVHGVDDGSGALKYAVCDNSCNCSVEDLHTHFYCESCHKTFCMKKIHVPVVALPPGFVLQGVNYVLKGLCAECSQKLRT